MEEFQKFLCLSVAIGCSFALIELIVTTYRRRGPPK